jgi:DNA-directed RNA polymerase subunit RPC12/RpoP
MVMSSAWVANELSRGRDPFDLCLDKWYGLAGRQEVDEGSENCALCLSTIGKDPNETGVNCKRCPIARYAKAHGESDDDACSCNSTPYYKWNSVSGSLRYYLEQRRIQGDESSGCTQSYEEASFKAILEMIDYIILVEKWWKEQGGKDWVAPDVSTKAHCPKCDKEIDFLTVTRIEYITEQYFGDGNYGDTIDSDMGDDVQYNCPECGRELTSSTYKADEILTKEETGKDGW